MTPPRRPKTVLDASKTLSASVLEAYSLIFSFLIDVCSEIYVFTGAVDLPSRLQKSLTRRSKPLAGGPPCTLFLGTLWNFVAQGLQDASDRLTRQTHRHIHMQTDR